MCAVGANTIHYRCKPLQYSLLITLAKAVRAHWAVENKLHWMLDVNFNEDACTVKKDNAPAILSLIRRVVLNMLSLDTTQPSFTKKKLSKRQKRKFANFDEPIMRSILGIQPL